MKGQADTYKEVKTFTDANAIVRVHIPDLDEPERNWRMKQIHRQAENLLKGVKKYD